MKLVCAGTKKSPTYYIQKSVRIGKRTTTKTIERLGCLEEIKARCGNADPIEWAKEYARELTLAEKKEKQGILLKYSPSLLIDKHTRRSCNTGYLFLQDIFYSLGLDKICTKISRKYKFEYDLTDIVSMLVYARILAPALNAPPFQRPGISWSSLYAASTRFTEPWKSSPKRTSSSSLNSIKTPCP